MIKTKSKKLILGLGTIATIAVPIVSVVSCGDAAPPTVIPPKTMAFNLDEFYSNMNGKEIFTQSGITTAALWEELENASRNDLNSFFKIVLGKTPMSNYSTLVDFDSYTFDLDDIVYRNDEIGVVIKIKKNGSPVKFDDLCFTIKGWGNPIKYPNVLSTYADRTHQYDLVEIDIDGQQIGFHDRSAGGYYSGADGKRYSVTNLGEQHNIDINDLVYLSNLENASNPFKRVYYFDSWDDIKTHKVKTYRDHNSSMARWKDFWNVYNK